MGNRYELGGRGIFELSRPGPQQDDSPSLLGATEVAQPACQHGRSDLPRKAPSLCDALELLLALLPQSLQHGIRHREHLLPPSYRGLNPWVYVSDVGIDGAGSKKQSERREDHRGGGRKRQGLSFGATRNFCLRDLPLLAQPALPTAAFARRETTSPARCPPSCTDNTGALGRIRTCAPGSGGRCSIP